MKSIEIITIGSEVLRGLVLNTNGAYISKFLDDEGWDVSRQTVLPDHYPSVAKGLKECLNRSLIVIGTGGLGTGPNHIAELCASEFFSLPASPLKNSLGGPSGCYFNNMSSALFLLPAESSQMKMMLTQEVFPILQWIAPERKKRHQFILHFCKVPSEEVSGFLRVLQEEFSIEIGLYPSFASFSVILRGTDPAVIEKARTVLQYQFRSHYYESANGKLEESIQHWMLQHQKTLACAESCTGGAISSRLTFIPGASHYFLGSLVAYSNHLKETLLHVSPRTLAAHGAVSPETVYEMWQGILKATEADFAIAVSGIAGPHSDGSKKPVGTVEYAIGFKSQGPEMGTLHLHGERGMIIEQAAQLILGLVWQQLKSFQHDIPAYR